MNYRVSYVNYLSDDHLSWTFVEINSIKSVRYQGDCNTASDLRFGAALSESVEVEVFNDTNVMLQRGAYIKVEIQNGLDGAWTYYGRYKVDKVISHEISYTAYAYDCTFDLDVDFSARLKELNDNGAFPITMARLAEEAVGVAGLNADYVITTSLAWTQILVKSFFSSNITCKDILIAASALTCQILEDAKNSRQYTDTAWANNADICFAPYYEVDDIRISNTEFIASTYRDIYYKENGLQLSDDKVNGLTEFKIINSQGDELGGWEIIIPPDPETGEYPPDPPASVYHVGGNILVDNAIGFTSSAFSWNTVADNASANVENAIGEWTELSAGSNKNMPCSLRVEMFPFYCPLKAGDLVWWHNQQFRIPIMHMTLDESVAEISCGGNKSYETSQDQYKTLGEQNTTNMVNIEEIRKIRDVIGPYEPYLKAEDGYAVGDYFVWQNQLVKCTSAISVGETIAIGTNVSAYSISKAINDMTPDDALSSTSTHPVQNAIITAALGALIESGGTTANGYFRFENGVQVCWGNYSGSAQPTTAVGNFYILSFNPGITFAKPFIESPNVIASPQANYSIVAALVRNTTGITSIDLCRPNAGNLTPRFMWVAVGRWKS